MAPFKTQELTGTFDTALNMSLLFEGGIDRNEIGSSGISNRGITQQTYNSYAKQRKLPLKNVIHLTEGETREFYQNEFFVRPKLDMLPDKTAVVLFDFGINASPRTAIKSLQKVVGTKSDGLMGPKTQKAVVDYIRVNGENTLLKQIITERENHNANLIKNNPKKYGDFQKGWENRIKEIKEIFDISALNPFSVSTAEASEGDSYGFTTEELLSGGTLIQNEESIGRTTADLMRPVPPSVIEKTASKVWDVSKGILEGVADQGGENVKSLAIGVDNIYAGFSNLIDWFGQSLPEFISLQMESTREDDEEIFKQMEDLGIDPADIQATRDRINGIRENVERQQQMIENIGDKISKGGKKLSGFFERAQQELSNTRDPAIYGGSFLENPSFRRAQALVMESIPSLGVATLIGMSTGNPFAGAAALGFGLEAPDQFLKAREAGASKKKANLIFFATGAGTTILEQLPLSRYIRGGEGKLVKDIAIGAAQEGIEEVAQSAWVNLIAKLGYDNTIQLHEGMVEAFIAGAGSGGIMGGMTSGRGIHTDAMLNQAVALGVDPQEIEVAAESVAKEIIDNADEIDTAITEQMTQEEEIIIPEEKQKTPKESIELQEVQKINPEFIESISNKDGTITVYRNVGDSNQTELVENDFVTYKKEYARSINPTKRIITKKVPIQDLRFSKDIDSQNRGELFYTPKSISDKPPITPQKPSPEPSKAPNLKDFAENEPIPTSALIEPKKVSESLIEQAKKYDTAEDFIQKVVGSASQYGDYNTSMRKYAVDPESNLSNLGIDPEKTITIYRGIDDTSKKIKREIKDGDFVTVDFDSALAYTGSVEDVVSIDVPAKFLYSEDKEGFSDDPFYLGSEYVYFKGKPEFKTDDQLRTIWEQAQKEKTNAKRTGIQNQKQKDKQIETKKSDRDIREKKKSLVRKSPKGSALSIRANGVNDGDADTFKNPADALLAQKWGKTPKLEKSTDKTINKTQIIKFAEDTFKVSIKGKATERMVKAAGLHYTNKALIRLKTWGELEVLAHEIAHEIDNQSREKGTTSLRSGKKIWSHLSKAVKTELKNLDYSPQRRDYEGFAEYMRHYLTETGLEATEAPKFHQFFINEYLPANPKLSKNINELRDKYRVWYEQGAENRIVQQIDFRGEHTKSIFNVKDKLRRAKMFIITKFVDELYTIKDIQRQIGGKKLKPTEDPFQMATYMKMKSGAIARTFVLKKAVDETGNAVGKSLIEALEPVSRNDMEKFIAYAVAKRALLIESRGKESGFDQRDTEFLVNKYADKGWDQAVDDITIWSNHLLDWIIRAGGLTEDDAKVIRAMNPIYIPFKRAFLDEVQVIKKGSGGTVNQSDPLKKLKGSGRPVINPIESLIGQATEMINKAQKLHLAKLIAEMANNEGVGGFITEVQPPQGVTNISLGRLIETLHQHDLGDLLDNAALADVNEDSEFDPNAILSIFNQKPFYSGKDNIVSIHINGKRRFYEIHPELYRSLSGVDILERGPVLAVLSKFSRLLRLGATQLNPAFGLVRNPFRDAFTYTLNSERKMSTPFDPVQGLYKDLSAKEGDLTWRFKAVGGELSGFVGYDRAAVWNSYDILLDEKLKGFGGKSLRIAKHPVDTARALMQISELSPRIAELEGVYKKALKDNPDWDEQDAFVHAFNAAQDVTVNFTRNGAWGKRINEAAAFFNASLQSVDKIGRRFKSNPIRTIVRGVAWLTIPALLSWWRNKDEQWYKNLPRAYKYSNQFFQVGDYVYRLPNPFEWGVIFISTPLAAIDALWEKDPKAVTSLFQTFITQIPDPTPTMFVPYLQVAKNKNFLGVPIESEGMKYLPKHLRKKWYSSTLAVSMAKGMADLGFDNISPVQLDSLMNGYTGGFYRNFTMQEIKDMADMPVLGSLIIRSPENPKRQLNDFFSEYEMLSQRKAGGLITKEELKKLTRMKPTYNALTRVHFKNLRVFQEQRNKPAIDKTYTDIQKVLENADFK